MNRNARIKTGLLLILVIAFVSGPTVDIDDTIKLSKLPQDLERYLLEREKPFTDIIEGTQKTIVWADPGTKNKTDLSLVFIHGFSASRQELSPLIENLAQALNANLFLTRLSGHGRDANAMTDASVNNYLNDAVEALQLGNRLGRKTVLIGNSTGATLATWLAYQYPADISQLVLLSPNFGPRRSEANLMLLPWGKWILFAVEGRQYSFDVLNERHARYWTTSFPSEALLPMMGLVKLVTSGPLEKINMPVLVLFDPEDSIVDIDRITTLFERFEHQHNRIVAFKRSQDPQHHILAGDILSPDSTADVQSLILDFLHATPQ